MNSTSYDRTAALMSRHMQLSLRAVDSQKNIISPKCSSLSDGKISNEQVRPSSANGRISTHADAMRGPRPRARLRRRVIAVSQSAGEKNRLTDSSDFWLLGELPSGEQSSPKWEIPCPGRR